MMRGRSTNPVIAGLDPAIQASGTCVGLDTRVKPGHDEKH
jgi:hypothetical protein